MKTDKLGIPIYSESDIAEIIYKGNFGALNQVLVDLSEEDLEKFNSAVLNISNTTLRKYQEINSSREEFDQLLQSNWLMPSEYKNMDIEEFLVHTCPKENYQRLIEELQEFRERNMLDLLKWMKYFVDTCRQNNVVWGVGRGSSVASYVLYLIGVHKIDSIKYNLDWREFLR
jgi:DNA polymerase III alpha subunit